MVVTPWGVHCLICGPSGAVRPRASAYISGNAPPKALQPLPIMLCKLVLLVGANFSPLLNNSACDGVVGGGAVTSA